MISNPLGASAWRILSLAFTAITLLTSVTGRLIAAQSQWAAPASLVISPDGTRLYVACTKAGRVLLLDGSTLQQRGEIVVNGAPSGLVLSPDGRTLFVTCAAPSSTLSVVDAASGKVTRTVPLGHYAMAPVLSPDGSTLYACNRFGGNVSVVDVRAGKELRRIVMDREPVSAAVTRDGKRLLVANHLHAGRSDGTNTAARVSVIDVATRSVIKNILLPNGSGLLREIRISPDGRYAIVTHLLARYLLPTTQVERGWINSNGLTLIDLSTLEVLATVLLDNVESGAATPWACGWSHDGETLFVTHAGTHEVSLINYRALIAKLLALPEQAPHDPAFGYASGARTRSDVTSDFGFLTGIRERIRLRGNGPRAATVFSNRLYAASYFSDDVEVIEISNPHSSARLAARIGSDEPMTVLRRGELLFNDATLCLQGWQSCAACHSEDARVDALNWDLLNDGSGNPKNSKSLLYSHRTPPTMSMGVRESAEKAVRAGIRHILFTEQPAEVANAMDEWLKRLTPIPSPYLENGRLSPAARRGEAIFRRADTACSRCHSGALFTDLREYDVGTASATEKGGTEYDTPTLIELWRSGPYLHDGSAATIREVLTTRNGKDTHGQTTHLKPAELDDLTAYLLSL